MNEDQKKEVIDQNEGAKNIKVKEISKTLTKVNDYIKARLKYKFENLGTTGVKTIYNNKKKETQKKENFNTLYINDIKGIYIDTSMLPEIDILLNNLEIDDNDSSCYLFTEKKLNLEKCKKLIKNIEQNCQNNATIKHRNEQSVPITLIDKDCHTIGNTDLYAEIMTKNIINNIRTQKRLEIFQLKKIWKKYLLIIITPKIIVKMGINILNLILFIVPIIINLIYYIKKKPKV